MATEDVVHPVEESQRHSGLLLSFNVGDPKTAGKSRKKEDAYDAILHAFKKAKEKADEKGVKVDAILLQEYTFAGVDKVHGLDALVDEIQKECGGDKYEFCRQDKDTVLIINTTVLSIELKIDEGVLKKASGFEKQVETQRADVSRFDFRRLFKQNPKQEKWEEQVDDFKNRWTASLLKVHNSRWLQFILLSYHQQTQGIKSIYGRKTEKKIAESAKVFVTEVLTKLAGAKKVPVLIGGDWNVSEEDLRRSFQNSENETWTFNTSGVKTLKHRDLDIDFYLTINGSQLSTKVIMGHHETLEHRESHFEDNIFDHDPVVVQYTLGNSQAKVEEQPTEIGNVVPFTPSVPPDPELPDHLLHELAKFTVPELRELCKKYKVLHTGNKYDLMLELYCLPSSRFTAEDFESKGTGSMMEKDWLEKLKQRKAERLKHESESRSDRKPVDHDAVNVQYTLGNSQAEVEEQPTEIGNVVPFTPSGPTDPELPDHLLHQRPSSPSLSATPPLQDPFDIAFTLTNEQLKKVCRDLNIQCLNGKKLDYLRAIYNVYVQSPESLIPITTMFPSPEERRGRVKDFKNAEEVKRHFEGDIIAKEDLLKKLTKDNLRKLLAQCIGLERTKDSNLLKLALAFDPPITENEVNEVLAGGRVKSHTLNLQLKG